jgi:hypothetical protein
MLVLSVMVALPFVDEIARELDARTFVPLERMQDWLNVPPAIATTAMLLPFGGLGVSMSEVGSRTALYRAAPSNVVGQVLSTKATLSAIFSILPTLTVGVLLDLLPAEAVLLGTAVVALIAGVAAWVRATDTVLNEALTAR